MDTSSILENPNSLVKEYRDYLKQSGQQEWQPTDELTLSLGDQLKSGGQYDQYAQKYPDFDEQYKFLKRETRPSVYEQSKNDIARGIDQTEMMGYGLAGAASEAVGAPADWAWQGVKRNEAELAANPPVVNWRDITTDEGAWNALKDTADVTRQFVLEGLPTMALGMGAGAIVKKLAANIAEKTVINLSKQYLASAAEEGLEGAAADAFAQNAAAKFVSNASQAGSYVGAWAGMAVPSIGGTAIELKQKTGDAEPATAFLYGSAEALVYSLPLGGLLTRKFGKPLATSVTAELIQRVGLGATIQGFEQAGAGAASDFIKSLAVNSINPNLPVDSPENAKSIVDSAISNGVMGLIFGAGHAAWKGSEAAAKPPPPEMTDESVANKTPTIPETPATKSEVNRIIPDANWIDTASVEDKAAKWEELFSKDGLTPEDNKLILSLDRDAAFKAYRQQQAEAQAGAPSAAMAPPLTPPAEGEATAGAIAPAPPPAPILTTGQVQPSITPTAEGEGGGVMSAPPAKPSALETAVAPPPAETTAIPQPPATAESKIAQYDAITAKLQSKAVMTMAELDLKASLEKDPDIISYLKQQKPATPTETPLPPPEAPKMVPTPPEPVLLPPAAETPAQETLPEIAPAKPEEAIPAIKPVETAPEVLPPETAPAERPLYRPPDKPFDAARGKIIAAESGISAETMTPETLLAGGMERGTNKNGSRVYITLERKSDGVVFSFPVVEQRPFNLQGERYAGKTATALGAGPLLDVPTARPGVMAAHAAVADIINSGEFNVIDKVTFDGTAGQTADVAVFPDEKTYTQQRVSLTGERVLKSLKSETLVGAQGDRALAFAGAQVAREEAADYVRNLKAENEVSPGTAAPFLPEPGKENLWDEIAAAKPSDVVVTKLVKQTAVPAEIADYQHNALIEGIAGVAEDPALARFADQIAAADPKKARAIMVKAIEVIPALKHLIESSPEGTKARAFDRIFTILKEPNGLEQIRRGRAGGGGETVAATAGAGYGMGNLGGRGAAGETANVPGAAEAVSGRGDRLAGDRAGGIAVSQAAARNLYNFIADTADGQFSRAAYESTTARRRSAITTIFTNALKSGYSSWAGFESHVRSAYESAADAGQFQRLLAEPGTATGRPGEGNAAAGGPNAAADLGAPVNPNETKYSPPPGEREKEAFSRPLSYNEWQRFNGVVDRMKSFGFDIQVVRQEVADMTSELAGKTGSMNIASRIITLVMQDVHNPTVGNFRTLLHEIGHFTVYDTIGKMDPGNQQKFFRTIDATARELFDEGGRPTAEYSRLGMKPEEYFVESMVRNLEGAGFGRQSRGVVERMVDFAIQAYRRVYFAIQKWWMGDGNADPYMAQEWAREHFARMVYGDISSPWHNFLQGIGMDFASPGNQARALAAHPGAHPDFVADTADFFDPITGRFNQPEMIVADAETTRYCAAHIDKDGPVETEAQKAKYDVESQFHRISLSNREVLSELQDIHAEVSKVLPGLEFPAFKQLLTRQNLDSAVAAADKSVPDASKVTRDQMSEANAKNTDKAEWMIWQGIRNDVKARIPKLSLGREKTEAEYVDSIKASAEIKERLNDFDAHVSSLQQNIEGQMRDYFIKVKNGQALSRNMGFLESTLKEVEGLPADEPIPAKYANIIEGWRGRQVAKQYDGLQALGQLAREGMDFRHSTPTEILDAINEHPTEFKNYDLDERKFLTALAKSNPRQMDQLGLRGETNLTEKMSVVRELNNLSRLSRKELDSLTKNTKLYQKEKDLRSRIRREYMLERSHNLKLAEKLDSSEQHQKILEAALPMIEDRLQDIKELLHVGTPFELADGEPIYYYETDAKGDWKDEQSVYHLQQNRDLSEFTTHEKLFKLQNKISMWLKEHPEREGMENYERLNDQWKKLEWLDQTRKYPAHQRVWLEKIFMPQSELLEAAGSPYGTRARQRFADYVVYSNMFKDEEKMLAAQWENHAARTIKETNYKSWVRFNEEVVTPVTFYRENSPGMSFEEMLPGALIIAKKAMGTGWTNKFDGEFAALLRHNSLCSDFLVRTGKKLNVKVREEFGMVDGKMQAIMREVIPVGEATQPRRLNMEMIEIVTAETSKQGWLTKDRATFNQGMQDVIDGKQSEVFNPKIMSKLIEPEANKPGPGILFAEEGRPIFQTSTRDAYAKSGGDMGKFLQALFDDEVAPYVKPENLEAERVAFFKKSMETFNAINYELNQLAGKSQTGNPNNPLVKAPHYLMDARYNETLAPEFFKYADFSHRSMDIMLNSLAATAAFGRDGNGMSRDLQGLEMHMDRNHDLLRDAMNEVGYDRGSRREGTKALKQYFKDKGLDYTQIIRTEDYRKDLGNMTSKLGKYFSRGKTWDGAFEDYRLAMELVGLDAAMIMSGPKPGLKQFLSTLVQPLVLKGVNYQTVSDVGRALGYGAKDTAGQLLEAVGVHLWRQGEEAKWLEEYFAQPLWYRLTYAEQVANINAVYENGIGGKMIKMSQLVKRGALQQAFQWDKAHGGNKDYAPFAATVFPTINMRAEHAQAMGQIGRIKKMLNKALEYYQEHPDAKDNPNFKFTARDVGEAGLFNRGDPRTFETYRNLLLHYGFGSFENFARRVADRAAADPQRTTLLSKEEVQRLATMTVSEFCGESSILTRPQWINDHPSMQVCTTLLGWGLNAVNTLARSTKNAEGQRNWKTMGGALVNLAAWSLPAAMVAGLALDKYDEKILKKRSIYRDPSDFAQEPLATAVEKLSQTGWAGLAGDLANALVNKSTTPGGVKDFSLDSRIVVMSQLRNIIDAVSTLYNQGGEYSYASVGRPIVYAVSGNLAIGYLQILNNITGADNVESRVTRRINAGNWLSVAGRVIGLPMRESWGGATATPVGMHLREMQLAAYAGDPADFMDNYRKAVWEEMKTPGKDGNKNYEEAQRSVYAGFVARSPLYSRFIKTPDEVDLQRLFSVMNPAGQEAVRDAMGAMQTFAGYIKP